MRSTFGAASVSRRSRRRRTDEPLTANQPIRYQSAHLGIHPTLETPPIYLIMSFEAYIYISKVDNAAYDRLVSRKARLRLLGMFVVTEADAAAIRAVFEIEGELSQATIELRRRFPGVTDNAKARACARTIAGWTPRSEPPSTVTRLRPRQGEIRPGTAILKRCPPRAVPSAEEFQTQLFAAPSSQYHV